MTSVELQEKTLDSPPSKKRCCYPSVPEEFHKITEVLPIIDESLRTQTVPLDKFYVACVRDKKKIGVLLKNLPEIPVSHSHLKRVDKCGRVLIQCANRSISDDVNTLLSANNVLKEDIEVVDVPSIKPVTRRQFDWSKSYWSTSFHPNAELEQTLSESCFSTSDLQYIEKWTNLAKEVGCVVVQNGTQLVTGCQGSTLLSHPVMQMVNTLAETDRNSSEYLATGCDIFLRNEPCAMCAMALVHARAERVFFAQKTTNGVLLSGSWQLHLQSQLNHHYKAFHVKFDKSTPNSVCGK